MAEPAPAPPGEPQAALGDDPMREVARNTARMADRLERQQPGRDRTDELLAELRTLNRNQQPGAASPAFGLDPFPTER